MRTNLIECRSPVVGHGGVPVAVLPDFTVADGDFLGIVGPNGSGKTSLLKVLAGLDTPVSGEVAFAPGMREGGIGYLAQIGPVRKDFPASVREVVRSGADCAPWPRPFLSRRGKKSAEDAMRRFGVAHLAGRPFSVLSGGERQRTLLARALASPRRLLLLDEPETGLDPEATRTLYNLLGEIHSDGVAIAMVTHDIPPMARLATHVLEIGRQCSWKRNAGHA